MNKGIQNSYGFSFFGLTQRWFNIPKPLRSQLIDKVNSLSKEFVFAMVCATLFLKLPKRIQYPYLKAGIQGVTYACYCGKLFQILFSSAQLTKVVLETKNTELVEINIQEMNTLKTLYTMMISGFQLDVASAISLAHFMNGSGPRALEQKLKAPRSSYFRFNGQDLKSEEFFLQFIFDARKPILSASFWESAISFFSLYGSRQIIERFNQKVDACTDQLTKEDYKLFSQTDSMLQALHFETAIPVQAQSEFAFLCNFLSLKQRSQNSLKPISDAILREFMAEDTLHVLTLILSLWDPSVNEDDKKKTLQILFENENLMQIVERIYPEVSRSLEIKSLVPLVKVAPHVKLQEWVDRFANDFALLKMLLSPSEKTEEILRKLEQLHTEPQQFSDDELFILLTLMTHRKDIVEFLPWVHLLPHWEKIVLPLLSECDRWSSFFTSITVEEKQTFLFAFQVDYAPLIPLFERYLHLFNRAKQHRPIVLEEKFSLKEFMFLSKAHERMMLYSEFLHNLQSAGICNEKLKFMVRLCTDFGGFSTYREGDLIFLDTNLHDRYLALNQRTDHLSLLHGNGASMQKFLQKLAGETTHHAGLYFLSSHNLPSKIALVTGVSAVVLPVHRQLYMNVKRLNIRALLPKNLDQALISELELEFFKKMKEIALASLAFKTSYPAFPFHMGCPADEMPFFQFLANMKKLFNFTAAQNPFQNLNLSMIKLKDQKELFCSAYVMLVIVEAIQHLNVKLTEKGLGHVQVSFPVSRYENINYMSPKRLQTLLMKSGLISDEKVNYLRDIVDFI